MSLLIIVQGMMYFETSSNVEQAMTQSLNQFYCIGIHRLILTACGIVIYSITSGEFVHGIQYRMLIEYSLIRSYCQWPPS